jgi:ribosome-binding factor A
VYVSVLGDERARAAGLEGLRSATGFLQRAIAREVRLRHTPALTFTYDESIDRGMRIAELLREPPPPARGAAADAEAADAAPGAGATGHPEDEREREPRP